MVLYIILFFVAFLMIFLFVNKIHVDWRKPYV